MAANMSEVLRGPDVAVAPIRLPGPGGRDANDAAALDDAWRAGYDAGQLEGRHAGRRDVGEFASTMAARFDDALARYEQTCAGVRAELAGQVTDLAAALVEAVLGHAPDAAVSGMIDRLYTSLQYIDDAPLALAVHPDTIEMISPALAARAGGPTIELHADDRLALGELVIEGPWAYAELTWPRLIAAAREALAELDDDQRRSSPATSTAASAATPAAEVSE
jgi:Flagellar assembly protein FliH